MATFTCRFRYPRRSVILHLHYITLHYIHDPTVIPYATVQLQWELFNGGELVQCRASSYLARAPPQLPLSLPLVMTISQTVGFVAGNPIDAFRIKDV